MLENSTGNARDEGTMCFGLREDGSGELGAGAPAIVRIR